MTPALTPWFDETVEPVRTGVYRADWKPMPDNAPYHWYAYWDGTVWGWMELSISSAVNSYHLEQDRRHSKLAWRGLSSDPEA